MDHLSSGEILCEDGLGETLCFYYLEELAKPDLKGSPQSYRRLFVQYVDLDDRFGLASHEFRV